MDGFVESPSDGGPRRPGAKEAASVRRGPRQRRDVRHRACRGYRARADAGRSDSPGGTWSASAATNCSAVRRRAHRGPQALVAALKRKPLFRALRCDKLILAALEATVETTARQAGLPVLEMLRVTIDGAARTRRADRRGARRPAAGVRIGVGRAQVGGGSLPRSALPSVALDCAAPRQPQELAAPPSRTAVPVIGYVSRDHVKLDLRTVFP